MNGILCIDKPAGFTSFDVVAKLRGMARTKKVGHGGTLDPMATGVLPVFIGTATRFCDLLPDSSKRYTAVLRLGVTTDTQDLTGEVLAQRPVQAGEAELRALLPRFTGPLRQIPPMYSAVQVGGKRLYDLARQGIEVERKPRDIEIRALHLLHADPDNHEYTLDVLCSKGAYIRTLCHDIGEALGCGGAMAALRRTSSCGFTLDHCVPLSEAQALTDRGELESALLPVDQALTTWPALELDEHQSRLLVNGVRLDLDRMPPMPDGEHRAYGPCGAFLGLVRPDRESGELHHIKLVSR